MYETFHSQSLIFTLLNVDLSESSQIQYNHEFVLCTQSMSILSVNWHGGGGANINERLT